MFKSNKAQLIMEFTIIFSLAVFFLIIMLSFIVVQVDKNLDEKHLSALNKEKDFFEDKVSSLLVAKDGFREKVYFSGFVDGVRMTLNMSDSMLILNSSRSKIYFVYPKINASFQISNGTLLFVKENNIMSVIVV